MKKAFTITELLVAVGLLAVVLAACGIIFNYSIDAQRTASATSEIMRNLRVITDQLNADFAGMRKDAPLVVRFDRAGVNADSVVFFSTGDFQDANGIVRGNVARIYYGQALNPNPLLDDIRNKILTRKQVILAPSKSTSSNEYEPNSLIQEVKEYLDPGSYDTVSDRWLGRPSVDPNNGRGIPMYLAKGVDDFTIMFCSRSDIAGGVINWPLTSTGDVYFGYVGYYPPFRTYPDLIRFNFTLYDSKGIIKTGRRFEHIVYIGR